MTCIVAVSDGTSVWMGADSAGVVGDTDVLSGVPKLFRRGPVLFGVSGPARALNVFGHDVPAPKRGAIRFVERRLGEATMRAFESRLALETEEGAAAWGGVALVGAAGRLFVLDNTFGVCPVPGGYAAVGSGSAPALGALYATRRSRLAPAERLLVALEASAAHATAIRPPFTFEVLQ